VRGTLCNKNNNGALTDIHHFVLHSSHEGDSTFVLPQVATVVQVDVVSHRVTHKAVCEKTNSQLRRH